MLKRLAISLLCLVSLSCQTKTIIISQPTLPNIVDRESTHLIRLSDFGIYNVGCREWYEEASQRFNNPVIICCHGGVKLVTQPDGSLKPEWYLFPDEPRTPIQTQKFADVLAELYPDRDIILVCCNPGGFDLKTKRVWYAKASVWNIPDDYVDNDWSFHEKLRNYEDVGSIWEFVTYDGREPTTKPSK